MICDYMIWLQVPNIQQQSRDQEEDMKENCSSVRISCCQVQSTCVLCLCIDEPPTMTAIVSTFKRIYSLAFCLSVFLTLFFSLSLSFFSISRPLSHTHIYMHTQTHTHTHIHNLSLSLFLSYTLSLLSSQFFTFFLFSFCRNLEAKERKDKEECHFFLWR